MWEHSRQNWPGQWPWGMTLVLMVSQEGLEGWENYRLVKAYARLADGLGVKLFVLESSLNQGFISSSGQS